MPFNLNPAAGVKAEIQLRSPRAQRHRVQQARESSAAQQRRANSRRQEAPIVGQRCASRQVAVARSRAPVNQFVEPAAVAATARFGAHGHGGSLNTSRSGPQGRVRRRKSGLCCHGKFGSRRHRFPVRPNHSFELTRYGRPPCLGGIRFANCVPPSQAGLPNRSAQFKR